MTENLYASHFKFQARFSRNLKGHDGPIRHCVFDEDTVLTASEDSTISVFDKAVFNSYEYFTYEKSEQTGLLMHKLRGHSGDVNCLAVDDDFIYSASDDKTIGIWSKVTKNAKIQINKRKRLNRNLLNKSKAIPLGSFVSLSMTTLYTAVLLTTPSSFGTKRFPLILFYIHFPDWRLNFNYEWTFRPS